MESDLFNNLAIFNELMLLLLGYLMYLFTDYVPTPETRYFFGKVLLNMLYFNVGVNLIVLGIEISGRAIRALKKEFMLRKLKKQRELYAQYAKVRPCNLPMTVKDALRMDMKKNWKKRKLAKFKLAQNIE